MTRIKLIFSVYGNSLDPKLFTEIAKLTPSTFWYKGDSIPNRKIALIRKETAWEYVFDLDHTSYFDDVANLFIKQFNPTIKEIAKFIKANDLESKLDIVVEISSNEKPSLFFNKKFLNLVAEINGEIDIDLYFSNEN